MNVNFGAAKGVAVGIILLIIIGVVATASVKIVDAGNRGVLLHWNAVDLDQPPLDEGLHFVVPFQDDVINIEVRTLKYEQETRSASKDLQTVETTVTVNYYPDREAVHRLYKNLGLDYENRVIQPAIEETVKQVTANYNAEELITKRPLVKDDIESSIRERLNKFEIVTEVISITDLSSRHYLRKQLSQKWRQNKKLSKHKMI